MGAIRFRSALIACFFCVAGDCHARDFFTDVWHVVTDPLKLGEASDNISASLQTISEIENRIYAHASALEQQANGDVLRDLEEVKKLESQINSDVTARGEQLDTVLRRRIEQLQQLEASFYADTADLVRCSTVNVAEEAKGALADALNQISDSEPTVYFLWVFPIAKVHVNPQSIGDPLEAWKRLEGQYVEVLQTVKEESDANIIPATYAKMMIATDRVLCVVKREPSTFADIQLEFAGIEARARPWVGWTNWIDWQRGAR
ncbi:hypothetical protein ACU8MW_08095 [Rhizobium leguminosarum]